MSPEPPAVFDVGEADFEARVVERSRELPVVVDFWAEWCGPCKALSPALERAATARAGRVELAKVDTDANPRLAAGFRVQGIPSVKAFRDGSIVSEFTGAIPPEQVERFFDSLLPSEADELAAGGARPRLTIFYCGSYRGRGRAWPGSHPGALACTASAAAWS